jgi:cytochrome P450
MDEIRPLIRRHANALIDSAADRPTFDAIDFAARLPRLVTIDFLGIDEVELAPPRPSKEGSLVIDAFSPYKRLTAEEREQVNKSIQASMDHTAMLYEKRRNEPRDDLLTALVHAQNEEGRLSNPELITLFSSIFGAGSSTSSIIASGMLELARHPEQAELLRRDPEQWKRGASEESLRYHPAINDLRQLAPEDTHAFGIDIPGGTEISVIFGSVNRDPSRWDDPERFDIRRDPGVFSLSFGVGAHLCLGHAMARASIEEALAVFVNRCDDLDVEGEPRWKPFVKENKLERLELRYRATDAAPV